MEVIRKLISKKQFDAMHVDGSLNKTAFNAELVTGLSRKNYWFQICIEMTVDCDTHSYAVIECHPRRG